MHQNKLKMDHRHIDKSKDYISIRKKIGDYHLIQHHFKTHTAKNAKEPGLLKVSVGPPTVSKSNSINTTKMIKYCY